MRFIFLLLLLLGASPVLAGSKKPPLQVTFLNPDSQGNPFWDNFSRFMSAAADDLGIKLKIVYTNKADRFEYVQLAESSISGPDKPDALVTIVKRNGSERLFKQCDVHQVECFTVNTDVPAGERSAIGTPREKYTHWVGQTIPDDKNAGTLLAEKLIEQRHRLAKESRLPPGSLIALNGSGDSSAALQRSEGLFARVQQHPEVSLKQILFTDWDPADAYAKTGKLLERYPDTNIVWGASDSIALAAIRAMKDSGHTPGVDFVAGGIDWSREGIQAVADGELSVSVGGHFIEGAIALILLFDRYNGQDFSEDVGTRYALQLKAIDAASPPRLMQRLQTQDWHRIDFRRFSKAKNPGLERYDFSIDTLLFNNGD